MDFVEMPYVDPNSVLGRILFVKMPEHFMIPEGYTRHGNKNRNAEHYPIEDGRKFGYGTAGFRADASVLTFVIYRMGYLAGLRSRHLNKAVGLMITASHNPENDNGVKLIDPKGEMLEAEWEKLATDLVNCSDEGYEKMCRDLERQYASNASESPKVLCGFDTRPSSFFLATAARCGVETANCNFVQYGLLTTPQLHYIVRCTNDHSYGVPTEAGYYQKYSEAFNAMLQVTKVGKDHRKQLLVDCANGVGAVQFKKLMNFIDLNYLDAQLENIDGPLNFKCGADYVKIDQNFPANFAAVGKNLRCASFDGDADRLVYFYRDDDDKFVLLDGDKIATLIAKFFHEQLDRAGLKETLSVAMIQTAYANGNSTRYIQNNLGLEVRIVPTGVKHLHHEAIKFDIGIYFEANGHGTVVFSDKFRDIISREQAEEKIEIKRLRLFSNLINEVVGDAMSDLLCVELLLMHYGWSVDDWAKNLYTDAPSCQLKVKVQDRTVFKTTPDETRLVMPASLQVNIDAAVSKCPPARCFVRPSGTEEIVRVYAEGPTPGQARLLAEAVKGFVRQVFGNIPATL